MPKIKFAMLPPQPGEENTQPILFRCKACKDVMRSEEIDGHAKQEHGATSVMVDTTMSTPYHSKELIVTDKTVPVFIDKDGEEIQVGWATPDVDGVRKVNLLEEFNNVSLTDVRFGDKEEFVSELDPETTQAPPRTFEEAQEPFEDIDGNVIDPVEPLELTDPVYVAPAEPVQVAPEVPTTVDPLPDTLPDDLPTDPHDVVFETPFESEDDVVDDVDPEDLPEGFAPSPAVPTEVSADEETVVANEEEPTQP